MQINDQIFITIRITLDRPMWKEKISIIIASSEKHFQKSSLVWFSIVIILLEHVSFDNFSIIFFLFKVSKNIWPSITAYHAIVYGNTIMIILVNQYSVFLYYLLNIFWILLRIKNIQSKFYINQWVIYFCIMHMIEKFTKLYIIVIILAF